MALAVPVALMWSQHLIQAMRLSGTALWVPKMLSTLECHCELGVPIPDQELHAVSAVPGSISRLRVCWATHSPAGCAMIPAR